MYLIEIYVCVGKVYDLWWLWPVIIQFVLILLDFLDCL
jgi:hypothetical protein